MEILIITNGMNINIYSDEVSEKTEITHSFH